MKRFHRSCYFSVVLRFGLALATALAVPHSNGVETSPRVIEITAKRFAFSPDRITLKAGEPVKLHITSEDVTHGFFKRALKIDEDITPGKATEISLTPQTTGTFTTICDHFCGTNHGSMKMTIVVE